MSPDILSEALSIPLDRAKKWAGPLSAAMAAFAINSNAREAAFLAQVGHESGGLIYVREIWGPTPAQEKYEGRKDLGNTEKGDGFKFRGRGLIQVTGRANYKRVGDALNLPLTDSPELLESVSNAAESACWFWSNRNLNSYADTGDFNTITRLINGGLNGLANRVKLWDSCKKALGA